MRKGCLLIVGLGMVLLTLALLCRATQGSRPPTPTPEPTGTLPPPTRTRLPTFTPFPSATFVREQAIRAAVERALGTGNRNVERVRSVKVSGYVVTVYWAINESLTAGLTKEFANRDIIAVLEALFTGGFGIGEVSLFGSYAMADIYGNEAEQTVISYRMGAATAAKINWTRIDPHDMYEIADEVWVDPSFQW